MIKKIAILTSGGDSQGMNNSIRAIVKTAKVYGLETFLVYEGYKGLVENLIVPATEIKIDQYINRGGTFIYSARYIEFKQEETRIKAKKVLESHGIEALVVIGGDGSYHGAQLLHKLGVKTIALPGTIDNDISSTDYTIGFDTALSAIVENVDRIRDTANSHHRCMLVEVMGRYAGDLSLHSGIATGAEIIITAENKMSTKEIISIVDEQMNKLKKDSVIIIISEHVYSDLNKLANDIETETKVVTRASVLAHLQRGGIPTANERVLATRMGVYAVDLLLENKSGLAIGIKNNKINALPILEALSTERPKLINEILMISKINQQ
ncbi:MAG: 6-phosphofructokinase [Mycoplasmataceae bacterium]|nr:6-phosphofructokinase [Mycoplasmataceae bacterium]